MAGISLEQLADDIYSVVAESAGKKKLKATDLTKEMLSKHGDAVSRQDVKAAIKMLIDSERCVYGYFGGSSIELPRVEGSANE